MALILADTLPLIEPVPVVYPIFVSDISDTYTWEIVKLRLSLTLLFARRSWFA
jgi:hypothetical protein